MMDGELAEFGDERIKRRREVQTELAEWEEVGPRRWVRRVREWETE